MSDNTKSQRPYAAGHQQERGNPAEVANETNAKMPYRFAPFRDERKEKTSMANVNIYYAPIVIRDKADLDNYNSHW